MARNGVFGKAGGGLSADTSWAKNEAVARQGLSGEKRTAQVLNAFSDKVAVIHDVRVPLPGFKANIDHVIVAGRHVYLIDSKNWKPGFYWTMSGKSRRGLERVPYLEKGPGYAEDAMHNFLRPERATVHETTLGVWPSNRSKTLHLWALRIPRARVIQGDQLARVAKRAARHGGADPAIVARLLTLI
jgi:hypothetical protein